MTQSEPITHARVLQIAVPIMLANIAVPLIGAVDTAVVGQIPQAEPIAAVGVGSIVLSALYWVFGFLRMGTGGLTAQAAGQGDRAEVAALLMRSLLIGLSGGVLLLLFLQPLLQIAFAYSPTSPEVEVMSRAYMQIRIWSAPAAIAMFGISGWLIAQERTRAVLALQLWMTAANVVLDVWFVLGLGWGVDGVAFASFLAEWSGLLLGLWLCRGALIRRGAWQWGRVFDRVRLKRMAVVNMDILIRSLLLEAVFLSFLFYYSPAFGVVALAANQVLMQFIHLMAYALDGFAFAAEALVGQALGAGRRDRLRQGAVISSLWGFIFNFGFALAFVFFGGMIIDLITKDPEVQQAARRYLPWIAISPLLALPSFMLDGIFIGATRTRDMRNMMLISALAYFAAVWLLLPIWSNHGLWAALMVSFVARGLTLGLRYPALERSAVSA